MRRMILTGCLGLLTLAATAQRSNGRVPSGPIKWSMQGSTEAMPGDLAYYYSSADTSDRFKRGITNSSTALGGSSTATRFETVRAQCQNQSVNIDWVAVQQFGADRYEIELSSDARNWKVVGSVPANRTEFGEANYNFNYNGNAPNAFYRITASNIGGDRISSTVIEAPCSNSTYLGATMNPVYSSTTIKIGSPGTSKVKMVLVDARGNVLQAKDATLQSGLNYIPLDMGNIPRGTYSLVISWLNGKQEILKLIKQ